MKFMFVNIIWCITQSTLVKFKIDNNLIAKA